MKSRKIELHGTIEGAAIILSFLLLSLMVAGDATAAAAEPPAPVIAPPSSAITTPARPSGTSPCPSDATALYVQVSPSVVSISAMSINPFDRVERISRVAGSGVIIDSSGILLTNSHVVFGRHIIQVTLDDGTTLPAKLVGADPVLDVAVIRIPTPTQGKLPAATLGDSSALRVGDDVFALGNPMGLDQTMTRGIVSGINRLLPDMPYSSAEPLIQTDAPINPGNSGGPLVDRCGRVVGISTVMMPNAQSIGFAIPSSLLKEVVPKLMKDGRVIRPWLGVQGQFVAPELKELFRLPLVDGIMIEVVEPGSPAQEANLNGGELEVTLAGQEFLLGGDIITAIDDAKISTPDQFSKALGKLKVGSNVRLTVFRNGRTRQVTCTLPERPVLPGDFRPGADYPTPAAARPPSRMPWFAF
jgi:serine protease Do